jgi:hypothetical protein
MRSIPDWLIQVLWWSSGIFGTGAVWYFLSVQQYSYAALSAGAAVIIAILAVVVHRRKDSYDQLSRSAERQEPHIPSIHGEPYAVARALLIRHGWIPRTRHWGHGNTLEVQSGNGPYFWEKGYHELVRCSGTGYALCRFEFTDPAGNLLVVITAGEAIEGSDHPSVFRVMRNPINEEGAYGDTLGI